MNTLNQILKNSVTTLIAFCILSLAAHFVFALINYKNEAISFSVKRIGNPKIELIDGFKYTNKQVGEIEMKPTFLQAVLLENGIYKDGGATMLFYLISSFALLRIIKKRKITLDHLTEKTLAKLIWGFGGLFLVLKIAISLLLDKYVGYLTKEQFEHFDNTSGFYNLGYLAIVIFNAVYGIIAYAKKLKQENDLTI
ncbi:hypothetical protein EZ449_09685 [Pedobacter frigidisoli]|uniref:DUF2975 domain-containing protein n=1 Tax=Pedobacter frigidisoli TaxID=2530455 RepID=A0A4R0P1H4_9SPHI|nr:hypothetical protein [Pedobacter frigidisoli]TCD10606.1 hypothetical protein EZ449_09685 [Pedobacter frigidisoli]